MPIRVECSRCHKVTYFADNDAGLAVACLDCKTHLRVPIPAAAPKAVSPTVHPDEPPPLFSSTPKHLMVAPPTAKPAASETQPHHAAKSRPVRPASPRSRWRLYSILLGIALIAGLAIANKYIQDHSTSSQAHDSQSATHPASKPATTLAVATSNSPATLPAIVAPPSLPSPPIVASIKPISTPQIPTRHYTPAAAPVGFIGFDRVELGGRTFIDSYNAAAGPYAKDSANANAAILSNGPIQLTVQGQIRGAIHASPAVPLKPNSKLTITGSTDALAQPLANPPIELDPLSHDSANAAMPKEYFKNGNFNLYGKHSASLPAGVYYVNDFTIDSPATLHLEGPVTFLISGQITLIGAIETQDNHPRNCRIRMTSDKQVTITHSNTLYLDIYAPQSPIRIDGKGDLYGSIVGKTLTVNGSRNFHFDESLLPH